MSGKRESIVDEMTTNLNRLIEVCLDGQKGYREAADHVDNTDYKRMFTELSQQRARFAAELQTLVASMGELPEDNSTTRAALHRALIDVKAALTGGGTKAVLQEVERGEDIAVDTYEEIVELALPAHAHEVVERQYAAVKEAHDRMKALRDIQ
jgi:uncharacterized protein (TIGR02284 family)